jgi:hypothetical protein
MDAQKKFEEQTSYAKSRRIMEESFSRKQAAGITTNHTEKYRLLDDLEHKMDAIRKNILAVYYFMIESVSRGEKMHGTLTRIIPEYEDVYVGLLKQYFPSSKIAIIETSGNDPPWTHYLSFDISDEDITQNKNALARYEERARARRLRGGYI